MEKHARGAEAPRTWIICKDIDAVAPKRGRADTDLPGLQSHVRYSVFKDRRHVERFPRCGKRTGNLALSLEEVKHDLFREGLFLQQGQYRCGRPSCQVPGHGSSLANVAVASTERQAQWPADARPGARPRPPPGDRPPARAPLDAMQRGYPRRSRGAARDVPARQRARTPRQEHARMSPDFIADLEARGLLHQARRPRPPSCCAARA